jgi:DNA-binding transcriptional ArsR family regulator
MTYQLSARDADPDHLQAALSALADPTRRNVFDALRGQPRSVADLASDQPVSRPAVSQHLKVLEQAGLVVARTAGTRRLYSIRREGLAELKAYLESFWTDILSAYAREVERQTGDDHD